MADDDELLRRARELGKQVDEANAQSAKNHQSAYERAAEESAIVRRSKAMGASLRKYLGPVGRLLAWLLGLIGKWLYWVCIEPPEKTGQGVSAGRFSTLRTIRNLVISLLVVLSLQVIAKGIYYYSTGFEETVYVTGKQEIETGELYQFGGCTSLPCSTLSDNGKFYLIESSLYFPIMFYPEENVFANIPQQDAACHVEGYGIYFRSLRWLYKSLQLYQHVVDVSCRPYTDLEIRQAVGDGIIVHDE
jgi:hypothetical protein